MVLSLGSGVGSKMGLAGGDHVSGLLGDDGAVGVGNESVDGVAVSGGVSDGSVGSDNGNGLGGEVGSLGSLDLKGLSGGDGTVGVLHQGGGGGGSSHDSSENLEKAKKKSRLVSPISLTDFSFVCSPKTSCLMIGFMR